MPAWADHEDVIDLWVSTPSEPAPTGVDEQIDTLCQIAEYKIKRAFPAIQDRIDADVDEETDISELGELAKYVVVQMVQSLYRNPLGLRYFQQQSGPFGRSGNYGAGASVLMTLSDDQKDMLRPPDFGGATMTDLDSSRDLTGPYSDDTPWVINSPEPE